MKVAIFSTKTYDQEYFDRFNKDKEHELTYFEVSLKSSTAKLASGFDVVCAFVNDRIDHDTIRELASHNIGLIALRCAGFNQVDLDAASKYGLRVMRVPAYSPHAVAEHAAALILSLNRKIHKAFNRIRDNNFSLERMVGFDLYGKTVGVIGTGNIGRVFGTIMKGFGCKVIAYDVHKNAAAEDAGIEYTDLTHLFKEADIISLHCPLTPSTYQLINKHTLEMMKKGVMLINTSRGKLINTADVIESLKERHLGYLGIDVYAEEEKIFFKDLSERIIDDEMITRLSTFPNVLITAHQGFLTREALEGITLTTLRNISDYAAGRSSENEVSLEKLDAK
ncbi:MAG TPA: 2-hydroxyacid dehydrogenase [Bacteroidales bacterium]|nr:2-hydroxyacid dehydrogenase [Bacteroidales bacterium]